MKNPEKHSLLKEGPAGEAGILSKSASYDSTEPNSLHPSDSKVSPTDKLSPKHPSLSRRLGRTESMNEKAITLSWKNLTVTAASTVGSKWWPCLKDKEKIPAPKQILKEVNGITKPGTFLVIMGASGSGKTTLLNCLTQRHLGNLELEGEVLVNGKNIGESINTISSYIQQDDLFVGTLTVREHLWFNAVLRMGRGVTDKQRDDRIDEVIQQMGLNNCEDVMIGTPGMEKGLSGGEKKRLAFASELLTRPSIMFCDEPTSGLDSFMAQQVIQSLKNLTKTGRTVLCTIHQPSSEIFAMFDEILMMAEGRVAFMGPTKDMNSFFEELGYTCPVNFNPADFFIYNLAVIPGREQESRQTVKRITDQFDKSAYYKAIVYAIEEQGLLAHDKSVVEVRLDTQVDSGTKEKVSGGKGTKDKKTGIHLRNKGYSSSWITQFKMNLWRSFTDAKRNKKVMPARVLQMLVAGLFLGTIYWQQEYSMTGVSNINGAMFMLMIQVSFNAAYTIATAFSREFPLFLKENQDRHYSTSAYFMGKILIDLPIIAFAAVLYTSVAYWMIGLYPSASAFFITMGALVLISQVAVGYGHLCSAIFPNPQLSLTLLPFFLGMTLLFTGFLVKNDSIVKIFKPVAWISAYRYTYAILLINQWQDVTYLECDLAHPDQKFSEPTNVTTPAGIEPPHWCYPNGMAVISTYQYTPDFLPVAFAVNVALFIGVEFLGYLFLRFKANSKS